MREKAQKIAFMTLIGLFGLAFGELVLGICVVLALGRFQEYIPFLTPASSPRDRAVAYGATLASRFVHPLHLQLSGSIHHNLYAMTALLLSLLLIWRFVRAGQMRFLGMSLFTLALILAKTATVNVKSETLQRRGETGVWANDAWHSLPTLTRILRLAGLPRIHVDSEWVAKSHPCQCAKEFWNEIPFINDDMKKQVDGFALAAVRDNTEKLQWRPFAVYEATTRGFDYWDRRENAGDVTRSRRGALQVCNGFQLDTLRLDTRRLEAFSVGPLAGRMVAEAKCEEDGERFSIFYISGQPSWQYRVGEIIVGPHFGMWLASTSGEFAYLQMRWFLGIWVLLYLGTWGIRKSIVGFQIAFRRRASTDRQPFVGDLAIYVLLNEQDADHLIVCLLEKFEHCSLLDERAACLNYIWSAARVGTVCKLDQVLLGNRALRWLVLWR